MFDIQTKSPLSYEGESNNWVYFDDLQVTHTKTRVLQYNEYYPFGLQTSTSWTREGHSNDFLYNDGSELNQASGWYETMFRGYDAALGRFLQVDPLAVVDASASPFTYAGNNPVLFNDPSGLLVDANGLSDQQLKMLYRNDAIYYSGFDDWLQNNASSLSLEGRIVEGPNGVEYGAMNGQFGYWINENYLEENGNVVIHSAFVSAGYSVQEGNPIILVAFGVVPQGLNKDDYFNELRASLIANGFSKSLEVKEYSVTNRLIAWWNNSPTGTVTFTNHYGDMPMDAGGHSLLNNPNSIIIYPGLDGGYGHNARLDTWLYVNATMHEIGHAFFGFDHDAAGNGLGPSASAPSLMDYHYAFDQGQGFNAQELKIIANSVWSK